MRATVLLVALLVIGGCAQKGDESVTSPKLEPVPIPAEARCPECGMFVKDYENWACEVILKSHEVKFFDDPGDMFLYYTKHREAIAKIYCRDYYTQEWVDAENAYYVTDAAIPTPMGFGIVVFARLEDAESFRNDYPSGDILSFSELAARGVKPR
jgi:nitrous oxide reductase accessory protein NosL